MSDNSGNQQILGDGGDGDGDGGGEFRNKQKKATGYGRKAKRVVLSQIKKAKKRLQRNKNKENRPLSSRPPGSSCLYFKQIPAFDSADESPTSDPNSSEFNFNSLRGLIEKSDFLLNECNTHFDVHSGDDNDD